MPIYEVSEVSVDIFSGWYVSGLFWSCFGYVSSGHCGPFVGCMFQDDKDCLSEGVCPRVGGSLLRLSVYVSECEIPKISLGIVPKM